MLAEATAAAPRPAIAVTEATAPTVAAVFTAEAETAGVVLLTDATAGSKIDEVEVMAVDRLVGKATTGAAPVTDGTAMTGTAPLTEGTEMTGVATSIDGTVMTGVATLTEGVVMTGVTAVTDVATVTAVAVTAVAAGMIDPSAVTADIARSEWLVNALGAPSVMIGAASVMRVSTAAAGKDAVDAAATGTAEPSVVTVVGVVEDLL